MCATTAPLFMSTTPPPSCRRRECDGVRARSPHPFDGVHPKRMRPHADDTEAKVVITYITLQNVSQAIDCLVHLIAADSDDRGNAQTTVIRDRLLADLNWVGLPAPARFGLEMDQHDAVRTMSAIIGSPKGTGFDARTAEQAVLLLKAVLRSVSVVTTELMGSALGRIANLDGLLPAWMRAYDAAGNELFAAGSGETIHDVLRLIEEQKPFTSDVQQAWVDGVTRAVAVMTASKSPLGKPARLDLGIAGAGC
jgi:hypothetical protein